MRLKISEIRFIIYRTLRDLVKRRTKIWTSLFWIFNKILIQWYIKKLIYKFSEGFNYWGENFWVDNCSNNGAYTTPQKSKISKNFILAQTENNLQSQTLDWAAFANLGNLVNNKHALFERESKDYLLVEGSEEKKTEMCLNSDFMHFNVSPMYQAEKRNSKLKKKADKSSNMLSYLFDIEEILYPKMLKPECKEDREDNNIEDLRVDTPKLISLRSDKNLISVNNSKNSMSFTSKWEVSQSESTTRRPEDWIEEKEGWILKRSFNHPNSIGWQK